MKQFKFNPELVKKLSIGELIVEHTQRPEHLPLIEALLNEAFPLDNDIPLRTFQFYSLSKYKGDSWGTCFLPEETDKALPIHDFLVKEETKETNHSESINEQDNITQVPDRYKVQIKNRKTKAVLECDFTDIANSLNLSINKANAFKYLRIKGDVAKEISDLKKSINSLQAEIDRLI